ncbi:MAG: indolepyruvate oxidoreductase subunit beta [Candidatus Krumholzibacteria bacterium]|nr:indolepyruvate oxidoreductase subunit beta [Candidatus Krumholzibacteria bacterium]MCK5620623.1 indolepyruvate oxidoreductase subunit beta [Candidatus Krumholzibacteria bacterium]
MKAETTNVLMAGVGGQGTLVASETLALAVLAAGLKAKQSEVHGVAQRGGSVVSHVRFGEHVYSPLIRCGEVDVLYASERLEALRYAHYLKSGGAVVMDNRAIKPIQMPGVAETPYPDDVAAFLRDKGYEVRVVPAIDAAIELGDKRCANVVLLGALADLLPLPEEAWQVALKRRFPEKILDLNIRAFAQGRRFATEATTG